MKKRSIALVFGLLVIGGMVAGGTIITRPEQLVDRTAPDIDASRVALAGWHDGPNGPVLVLPSPDGDVDVFRRGENWFDWITTPEDLADWPMSDDAPYYVHAVETRSSDGTRIAATYFEPPRAQAGLVIIHGSGDSNRRNSWYIDIADQLARNGIAVWFPDKRGTGASEGRWRDASFELLATDAAAGQEALAELMGVSPSSVGYLGISQGGWIAPLAAQIAPAPFLVVFSAAAVTPNEQLRHEVRANLRRDFPDFILPVAMPIASNMPRWRHPAFWNANGSIDPVQEITASRTPTLVLLGDLDEFDNIPVARSLEMFEAAAEGGADIEVLLVRGGGHDLSPGEGVGPVDRAALARVEAFIADAVAAGRADASAHGSASPERQIVAEPVRLPSQ